MRVKLNEKDHTYTSDQGVRFVSATDLVKMFCEPFDPVEASKDFAKKNGHTPEHWQKLWAEAGVEGSVRGNALHKSKEIMYNGRGAVKFRNSVRYVKNQAFYPDLGELADGIYAELVMWLEAYQLAGKADVVNIRTTNRIRYADLDDHKTGKRIHMKGYAQGGASPRKMLFPLNHLEDCNHQHIELQLSIYMYILEMHGYEPGVLQFTHYGHADSLGITPPPKVYPLTYRKAEVKAMLKHYRQHGKR